MLHVDLVELAHEMCRLRVQRLERRVLDLVPAEELPHYELAVEEDVEALHLAVERQLEPRKKRLILGHVVGRHADEIGELVDDGSSRREQHRPDAGGAGVPARPAVGVETMPGVGAMGELFAEPVQRTASLRRRPARRGGSRREPASRGGRRLDRRHGMRCGATGVVDLPDTLRPAMRLHPNAGPGQRLSEDLAPAQHGLFFDDVMGRINQAQALRQGRARLVVLDIARDEHVRDRGGAAGDGLGAGAGQTGHPSHSTRAVAGVAHRRQPQHGRDLGGEGRQRQRFRQLPQPAETETGYLVLDRIDVEGRFLVGMGGDVGADDATAEPPREHDLEADLLHRLVATRETQGRIGPLEPEERALPLDGPRAVLVVADDPGADREDRLANEIDVVGGHEPHELQGVGLSRRQRRRLLETEHVGHDVGDPAVSLVETRVRDHHRSPLASHPQRHAADAIVLGETLQRRVNERVMREYQLASEARSLVEDRIVDLERDEHACDRRLARTDLQTHVVPRLGEPKRGEPVNDSNDVPHLCHELILPYGVRTVAVTAGTRPRVDTARRLRVPSPARSPCTLAFMATPSAPGIDPATLSGPGGGGPRSWPIVLALLPGILLTLADATVMSVAVPLIIRRLESTVISVSWVMNGYNLVLTVLFLTMGRLADRYGHKRVFVAGLALFTLASLGCARAGSIDQLITFRVVQAVGAAAVIPTALALMLDAFPAGRQGYAAGLFGALSSAAAALGPVLGGVLIERWGWQAIFWFNVPVGVLGVALALALVRGRRRTVADARLDWLGVGLSSAGLFCLTLALIEGNDWGWTSLRIIGLFAAAAALLALFVVWELRTASPLFDLRLFRDRTFAAASGAIMTVDIAMMGTAFMLVIYMIAMMNYSELKAGLAVTTLPVAGLLLAPFAGRLVDRVGPRPLAVTGALLTAAGLFALGHLERTAGLSDVLWRSALVGAGLGLSLPALTAAGMSVVPGGVKGVGSGVLNTARQLGFLLGVAILVAVFSHTMSTAVNRSADRAQDLTRAQTTLSPDVRDTIVSAIDEARGIDVSAGMSELRKIANPIANVIAPKVGLLEKFALVQLKDDLEVIFWDEASAAFRWPFYTAGIAALIAVIPGMLLPRRLPHARE